MANVQARLPDDLENALDELAEDLRTSRSEALRRALDEGLRSIHLDRAVDAFTSRRMTLSRAAEYADVSVPRMAGELADRGVALFRQSPEALDRDLDAVDAHLADEAQ